MNKWSGKIGFFVTEEVIKDGIPTGVWKSDIIERKYFGDIVNDYRKLETAQYTTNSNIGLSNSISLLSDQFINDNLVNMKYIEFRGHKFSIQSIKVEFPRITVQLGGVYHESEA